MFIGYNLREQELRRRKAAIAKNLLMAIVYSDCCDKIPRMSALVYLIGESEASCLDCEIRSELVLVQASRAQTRLSYSEKPYVEFKNDMTE